MTKHYQMIQALGYYIVLEESSTFVVYAWAYKEDPTNLFEEHDLGWGCNLYGWGDTVHEALGHLVMNSTVTTPKSFYLESKS